MGCLAAHLSERILKPDPKLILIDGRLHMQHNIERRQAADMLAKSLPRGALQTIALMRPAAGLAPNDQPQPRPAQPIAGRQDAHRPGPPTQPRFAQHHAELPGRPQSTALGEALRLGYADNRLRPLARRALMILRPPLVAILARNPWFRLRLMLLGW